MKKLKTGRNLEKAKNWEKSGKSADDIWKETGWEKGTDGKWKFEIDDSKAEIKNIESDKLEKASISLMDSKNRNSRAIMLPDLLEHKELFKQYPNLKDIRVYFDKGDFNGNIDDSMNITLTDKYLNQIGKDVKLGPVVIGGELRDIKSTLLHEIQHYIQKQEGFAIGGDTSLGFDMYKKLAGETEARNVQSRLLKTPDERKLLRPAKTEDVERKMQIIKMEGGKSMSMDKTALLKGSDDLISEARKYKSAEEFVNKKYNFIHESNQKIDNIDFSKVGENTGESWYGPGFYLQEKLGFKIEKYGDIKTKFMLNPNVKIFNTDKQDLLKYVKSKGLDKGHYMEDDIKNGYQVLERDLLKNNRGLSIIEQLKKDGYSGINVDGELVIYNKDAVISETKLKQIYEQAQKSKPLKKSSK